MMFKSNSNVKIGFREKLIIIGPAVLLSILAFIATLYLVDPFPPRHITIGCGPKESANYNYAQSYREILAREGIALELKGAASGPAGKYTGKV